MGVTVGGKHQPKAEGKSGGHPERIVLHTPREKGPHGQEDRAGWGKS